MFLIDVQYAYGVHFSDYVPLECFLLLVYTRLFVLITLALDLRSLVTVAHATICVAVKESLALSTQG
jgi:hypothetical protein